MTFDDALLALLRTDPVLNVHDGYVDADETQKIITVPLPYVVFFSGLGDDIDERLGGRVGGSAIPFQTTYVGGTPEQARWAGQKARAAVSRKRVVLSGRESGLIRLVVSSLIRREDTYTRPGGGPLFFGVDQYEVGTL